MLTGGEPMLNPNLVILIARSIKCLNSTAQLYMYTALTTHPDQLINVLQYIDGICVTLHEACDLEPFIEFDKVLRNHPELHNKSFRLNVFHEVQIGEYQQSLSSLWKIKTNIEWIKNCPLPSGEVLMRLFK
jgi:hypothetical protein